MRSVIVLTLSSCIIAGCGKEKQDDAAQTGTEASSTLPAPQNEADRVLANLIGHFEALNSIMSRIDDEESARIQVSEVQRIVDQLHVTLLRGQALEPDEKAEATARYQEQLDEQTQRFSRNLGRLTTIPGASAPIIEVLESMPGVEPAGAGEPQPSNRIDLANPPGPSDSVPGAGGESRP